METVRQIGWVQVPLAEFKGFDGDQNKLLIFGAAPKDCFYANDVGAWNITRAHKLIKQGLIGGFRIGFADLWKQNKHLEVDPRRLASLHETLWWKRPLICAIAGPLIAGNEASYLIDGVHRMNLIAKMTPHPREIAAYVFEREQALSIRMHFLRGDGVEIDPNTMEPRETIDPFDPYHMKEKT